jgi:hypothetical protein
MTKEQARECLKDYLENRELPIVDAIAVRFQTPLVISDITFVGLLCIAYDLKPISKHELNKSE